MKALFWNVDTQYDFMRKDGKLYIEGAESIEDNLAKLTSIAKELEIQVINTADWHNKDSKEISDKPDYIKTFPSHCMENTDGAEFIPATDPENPYIIDWAHLSVDEEQVKNSRNIVLLKDDFDVFAGTPHVDTILDILQPDTIFIYGVATNVCVDYAVQGLKERGIEIVGIIDAMKELPNIPIPEWDIEIVEMSQIDEVVEDIRKFIL